MAGSLLLVPEVDSPGCCVVGRCYRDVATPRSALLPHRGFVKPTWQAEQQADNGHE